MFLVNLRSLILLVCLKVLLNTCLRVLLTRLRGLPIHVIFLNRLNLLSEHHSAVKVAFVLNQTSLFLRQAVENRDSPQLPARQIRNCAQG